jgi:hypothetical protein
MFHFKSQFALNMKTQQLILFAFPLLFVTVSLEAKTYYQLQPVWERQVGVLQPIDLDSDGTDEIAGMTNQFQIDVKDWKLQTFYRSFLLAPKLRFGALFPAKLRFVVFLFSVPQVKLERQKTTSHSDHKT